MRLRRDGVETRRRILEAACVVFSEKGYRRATHAEICKRAGTNTAAINYHFHDKQTLYVEAWRLAFHRSIDAHPPDGGVAPGAPPEERLGGRIGSIMHRILDPQSHEFGIVHKEHANPTGLLAEVTRECIEPLRRQMTQIVRELLGDEAPDEQVHLCQMSIMAQCLHIMVRQKHNRIYGKFGKAVIPPPVDVDVAVLAEHVTQFSLAAIREIRRQTEIGEPAYRKEAHQHAV